MSKKPREQMTVVCAWCGLVLVEGGETISHAICDPCRTELEGDEPAPPEEQDAANVKRDKIRSLYYRGLRAVGYLPEQTIAERKKEAWGAR